MLLLGCPASWFVVKTRNPFAIGNLVLVEGTRLVNVVDGDADVDIAVVVLVVVDVGDNVVGNSENCPKGI